MKINIGEEFSHLDMIVFLSGYASGIFWRKKNDQAVHFCLHQILVLIMDKKDED